MPPNAVEAGIKDLRVHFLRETLTGVIQSDPAWLRYSDTVTRIQESPNANVFMQRGAGEFDIQDFLVGPEDHGLEITYDLQNWLTAGNDAAADGLLRAADGAFLNTHAYQSRQDLLSGGSLVSGRRIYTIGTGGRIGRVSLSGDPNTGEPLKVALTYVYEKLRSYVIDQPASTGVVTVVSDNAADTSQTVTVENAGAGTSEGIALNGTTPVAGVTSFADVDSLSLSAETIGDITISHTAAVIAVILGKTSNGGFEGDLGIPALGSGSFQSALGPGGYEQIVGSSIQRGGSDIEDNATISNFEIQVENNLSVHPRIDSRARRIIEGSRDVSSIATIFSEKGSHDAFVENLKATEADIVWTLTGGSITVLNAALTGLGGRSYEAGQAVMQRNNTFTGRSIAIA